MSHCLSNSQILEDPVYDCVIKQLKHHQNTQQDKFIICLNKVVKNFPPLADRYVIIYMVNSL